MTPRTLIEPQQFIEEEVKKLIHRRGIIMGGFLTLWILTKLRFLIPRGDLLIQDFSSLSRVIYPQAFRLLPQVPLSPTLRILSRRGYF
jgi:hypothetical protein